MDAEDVVRGCDGSLPSSLALVDGIPLLACFPAEDDAVERILSPLGRCEADAELGEGVEDSASGGVAVV